MKPITSWYGWNPDTEKWVFNHIENGHSKDHFPTKKLDDEGKPFPAQRSWHTGRWKKEHAHLDDNDKIIYEATNES